MSTNAPYTSNLPGNDFALLRSVVSNNALISRTTMLSWSFDNVWSDDVVGNLYSPIGVGFAPGLFNEGVYFPGNTTFELNNEDMSVLSPYNGGGVSHCFWIKVDSAGTGWFVDIVITGYTGNDGHVYEFDFILGGSYGFNNPAFFVTQDPSTPGPQIMNVTIPITWVLGSWNLLVLTYDPAVSNIAASVNGSAYTYSGGAPFTLPPGNFGYSLLAGLFGFLAYPTVTLDNYLITTNRAMSTSDIAFIWNSGSGRQWPWAFP